MKARRDLIEAEQLALQRDEAAFWARIADRAPSHTRSELEILQRALDAKRIDLGTDRDRRGLGIALGMILAHELGLQWVRLADDFGVEMALTNGEEHMNAHPLPMIENRAQDGASIQLGSLFESVARLFADPTSTRDVGVDAKHWQAHFDHPGKDLAALERRLGTLVSTLQVAADLSYVMIRGTGFSLAVDSGRGDARDLTMQVSFAGDRVMLAVGGGKARELAEAGARLDLHQHAKREIERAVEEYLAAHPEAAEDFAPFTEDAAESAGDTQLEPGY